MDGALILAVENTGGVPIRVVEERKDGGRIDLATLDPCATADQRVADGARAVFVNTTQVDAQVRVKITGDTGLSMGYAATE